MGETDERVGVDFAAVLPPKFAKVIILGQQRSAVVDTCCEKLMGQGLGILPLLRVKERRYPIGGHVRHQVEEHLALDEHEASAAVAHLDEAFFVRLLVTAANHVEHERASVIVQVVLALTCCLLDALPVHFLLGVDATSDVLVSR